MALGHKAMRISGQCRLRSKRRGGVHYIINWNCDEDRSRIRLVFDESKGPGSHYSHYHNPSFPCPALCAADLSCSKRGLPRGLASRLCPVMVSILA